VNSACYLPNCNESLGVTNLYALDPSVRVIAAQARWSEKTVEQMPGVHGHRELAIRGGVQALYTDQSDAAVTQPRRFLPS
jgi:hypothetical protein